MSKKLMWVRDMLSRIVETVREVKRRIPISPLFQIVTYVEIETADDQIGVAEFTMNECLRFPRSQRGFKKFVRGIGKEYAQRHGVAVTALTCITKERYNQLSDALKKNGSTTRAATIDFEAGTVTENEEGKREKV